MMPEWPLGTRQGWLPIGIWGRYLTVRWLQFGSRALSEPFFQWSVAALRDGLPTPAEFETSIETLARCSDKGPSVPVPPAGIIVHVTRCGSTLVLNALRAADDVVAVGEAQPITTALSLAGAESEGRARLGRTVAASLLNVFASYRGDTWKKLVLKSGLDGMFYLKQIRSIWQNVPILIIIRNPAEVVVSNLWKPPNYLSAWYEQDCPFGAPPAGARSNMRDFCSWLIGQSFLRALEGLDDKCMVVDYANLSPEFLWAVATRFGLRFSAEGEQEFYSAFDISAKAPEVPFSGDSPRKREAAQSSSIRESVERWALDGYLRLKEHAVVGAPTVVSNSRAERDPQYA
jgi:hypothetical protein